MTGVRGQHKYILWYRMMDYTFLLVRKKKSLNISAMTLIYIH